MPLDFRPTATWEVLRRRARLLQQLRQFFVQRGFLEVETPLLSADTVVDRHLDPLSVCLFDDPRTPEVGRRCWLQTSPEFGLKRLLAAGGEALFQVTRAFRGGERGPRHNPEFTLVEWYRVGDDYAAGMDLLAELARELLERGPPERVTYQEAFRRYAGLDPWELSDQQLVDEIRRRDPAAPAYPVEDRDSWLNLALASWVEPCLGRTAPTLLYDYPPSQAALARVRPGPPPVAERFELYVEGVELANGYHELLEPAVLRRRNAENNQQRRADGKPELPTESRLLAAMDDGLPASSGVALGFDRLVMAVVGARDIAEVLTFPSEIA